MDRHGRGHTTENQLHETTAPRVQTVIDHVPAAAQDVSINFGQGTGLTERVIQMVALLTVLSPLSIPVLSPSASYLDRSFIVLRAVL